jgi:hypothetical protein
VAVTGANEVSSLPATDQGNGSYSASYTPTHTGLDVVDVRVSGNRLHESPFASFVVPGPASPVTTTAEFTRTGVLFVRVDVVVTTRDAQGNLVSKGGDLVEVQRNGANLGTLQDNGDGTYSGGFLVFAPVGSVGITLNGQPITGSPFNP